MTALPPGERPPPQSQHRGFSKQRFTPQRKWHNCQKEGSQGKERAVSTRAGQREGPRPRKNQQRLENVVAESRNSGTTGRGLSPDPTGCGQPPCASVFSATRRVISFPEIRYTSGVYKLLEQQSKHSTKHSSCYHCCHY